MSMRLKLAFSHARSDRFRVHAIPLIERTKRCHGREHFIVEYADEGVFLDLIDQADVDPAQQAHIILSIAALDVSPDTPACCEDVCLDGPQLLILLNGAIQSQIV